MTENVEAQAAIEPVPQPEPAQDAIAVEIEVVESVDTVMADASAHAGDALDKAPEATQETEESPALSLASQVEALLYASGEPASLAALAGALDATSGEIEAAIEELTALYAVRGIRLQRSGNKVQLVTAPEIASKVQKFLGLEEVNRLSSAALETLAIIAYNQPITRPQIEMIRGVNCDGVITTLLARNLVQELGRADTVGHPMRYGVSFEFLQYFGLRNVHELPPVEKLDTLPMEKSEPVNETPIEAQTEVQAGVSEVSAEAVEAPASSEVIAEQADPVETTFADTEQPSA